MNLLRKIGQLLGNFTTHEGVIVLTYHRVNDKLPKGELVVDQKEFAKQMLFLSVYRNRFQVIGLKEMLEWFKGKSVKADKHGSGKTKIVITLDDGYRDNYINAFPVLKRYRFPAVVFLATGHIGTEYRKPRYANVPWKRDYLNIDEIKEMTAGGISFGAHTRTHPHLTQIGADEAKDEVVSSYKYLQGMTDGSGIPFCYPYGEFNDRIKDIVKETGCSSAFSVKSGINYAGQDIFEIRRVDVLGNDDFSAFKYKITDKYSI